MQPTAHYTDDELKRMSKYHARPPAEFGSSTSRWISPEEISARGRLPGMQCRCVVDFFVLFFVRECKCRWRVGHVPFSSASDGLQLQPAGCTRSRRAARQRQTKETSNQQVHARSAQGKSPRILYLLFFFLFLGRSGAQAGAVRSGAQVGNGFLLFLRGTNGRGGPQRVSMSFSGLLRTFLSSSRLAPATSTCRAHKYCSSFFARGLPAVRV